MVPSNCRRPFSSKALLLLTLLGLTSHLALAQRNRISRPIVDSERIALGGHLPPKARPEFDRGRVAPSLEIPHVTLTFALTEAQQAELDGLLASQQDPASSNYHRWLTPEEYGQRFGIGEGDLSAVTAWVESQGLTLGSVARGRNWIVASGPASAVEKAFGTELRTYSINGESYFANSADPSVPAALAGVVKSIRGLNNFRMKSPKRHAQPEYTSAGGNHYLSPDDFAAIYNVTPLYKSGIDGSGQKLVIAGQTQIVASSLQQFRTKFGLTGNDPQVILVPNSKDPGVRSGDVDEADLDLEWSTAVARNATILYVYADDVMQAVQYAVDQNLAPVVSTSYGSCEPETSSSESSTMRGWAKQANSQGITWFSASGDAGGADCNDTRVSGVAVDIPASIPEVTGVGGTEFDEGDGVYWVSANTSGASVLSYIPEKVWNDSVADGQPSAGGGGASLFFSKPAWQRGPGVPDDNSRHVPDISMNASADHDGYLVYTGGKLEVYGGTSAPAPAFAGLTALLNQYLVKNGFQNSPGVGNMNPTLYSLAQSRPEAFHDIVSGDNMVTTRCGRGAANCSTTGVGFSAGPGYDQATGLGSIDAAKLFEAWSSAPAVATAPRAVLSLVSNLTTAKASDTVLLIATVVESTGPTPTGTVTFSAGGILGSAVLVGSGGKATASLEVSGAQLGQGSGAVTASYTGTGLANGTTASITVTVQSATAVSAKPAISSIANAASYTQALSPGMILTVFGTQLAQAVEAASSIPLPIAMGGVSATINGVPAPLYYVSPTQINLQVPYEVAINSAATLRLNNNGQIATRSLTLAAAGPGIFTGQSSILVPTGTAVRGQSVSLYLTGAGAVTPELATGNTPFAATAVADLPKPAQSASVTIGGLPTAIQFVGNSSGLVGVVQINLQVPSQAARGMQPVVVTIGGTRSAPAQITIN